MIVERKTKLLKIFLFLILGFYSFNSDWRDEHPFGPREHQEQPDGEEDPAIRQDHRRLEEKGWWPVSRTWPISERMQKRQRRALQGHQRVQRSQQSGHFLLLWVVTKKLDCFFIIKNGLAFRFSCRNTFWRYCSCRRWDGRTRRCRTRSRTSWSR